MQYILKNVGYILRSLARAQANAIKQGNLSLNARLNKALMHLEEVETILLSIE
jgi:hypothetical protein